MANTSFTRCAASIAVALCSTTALAGGHASFPLPYSKPANAAGVRQAGHDIDLAVLADDVQREDPRPAFGRIRGEPDGMSLADASNASGDLAVGRGVGLELLTPSAFETQEYANSWGLGAIGASAALAAGSTGRGVTVGVVDSGIDVGHPEFAGRIHPASADGYGRPLEDVSGHGTGVSSVIAGALDGVGTHGVAPDATVLALRADVPGTCTPLCSFDMSVVAQATDYAVANGARVINYSLSGASPSGVEFERSVIDAAGADAVLVFAAGNNSTPAPEYPGRYVSAPALNGQGIVVGAIDAAGNLADFSALPGDAADFYLVAPGVAVPLARPGGAYELDDGTSFAAPHVSGAAAGVISAWPWLEASEVVEILLGTAIDLGAPGVDPVYGRGLLNLGGVFAPVGLARLPTGETVEDGGVSIADSALRTGGAFGGTLARSQLLKRAIIIDEYGRDFGVDLSARIAAQRGRVQAQEWAGPQPEVRSFGSKGGSAQTSYAFRRDPRASRFGSGDGASELERFTFTTDLAEGTRYAFSRGFGIGDYFGLATTKGEVLSTLLRRDGFTSPYLGLVDNGDAVVLGHDLGGGLELRVGMTMQDDSDAGRGPRGERTAYLTELRRSWEGRGHLSAQFGMLNEQDGVLGSTAEGAFALAGKADTRFIGLSGAMELGDRVELYGHVSVGWTDAGSLSDGIFEDLSSLRTTAWGLGAGVHEVATERDRLDVTISQPVRITSGSASISAPTGTTETGAIVRESERLSLVPNGRQLDLEVAYRTDLGSNQELQLNYVAQLEPGHEAKTSPEHFFGVRYALKF